MTDICPTPDCTKEASHTWEAPTPFGVEQRHLCLNHANAELAAYGRPSRVVSRRADRPDDVVSLRELAEG